MLYGLVPLIVPIILGFRYLAEKGPSRGSKVAVVGTVVASLLIWWRYPQWLVAAILLQSAVSIYVLICFKVCDV